ncbi:MAG: helix-turn-helix domain-containing protein [Ilumatobacteraceae bacterium]
MGDEASIGTGTPSIDALLGGLIPGDNVVWVGDSTEVWEVVAARFLSASANVRPTLFVACTAADVRRPLPDGIDRLDAPTASPRGAPGPLADALEEYVLANPTCAVVIPGFGTLTKRWGAAQAVAFFARTCPTMLQTGALTFWWLPSSLGSDVLDQVRYITQVMLEIRGPQLHITKAESRPATVVGSVHDLHLDSGDLQLSWNPSAGRLARGLVAVRRDLGLSQAQVARAAGVTPSAISQAESGARGLSVDTLITLADRLGISLDRLVSSLPRPGYLLARHDRSRLARGRGVTVLADDATMGLRAYFVALDANDQGEPPIAHQGIELVAVARGLVQVETEDDTPVLRAGDSMLTTTASITRWRNLRPDPAAFYWILRD